MGHRSNDHPLRVLPSGKPGAVQNKENDAYDFYWMWQELGVLEFRS
ncbi:MAG: hypothetical protein GY845_37275 [Planctomycetes bacterium]|nr:hypothetical protein [Planctomycetota bacterium]